MSSYPRMALGLFGIAVALPLACQKDNPAFDLGDVGETRSTSDGELSSNGEGNTSAGDGDPNTGDGDGDHTTGDGDGDHTTGDGDGEPTTGDGDGEPTTGDGDGDPNTGDGDGDPNTGDGDGDPNTGDGDGDKGDGDGDSCSGANQSCANGQTCCDNLSCCAGIPIPMGMEFCSEMCPISDRNLKFGFQSVDSQWVLDQVVELPISTWSYKDGKDGHARHIGPMAQDFHSAFGVGASDRLIFQIDADGVSFAAIQALDAKVETLEAENARLRATLSELEARLAKLEKK
jgi:hypothetical protein